MGKQQLMEYVSIRIITFSFLLEHSGLRMYLFSWLKSIRPSVAFLFDCTDAVKSIKLMDQFPIFVGPSFVTSFFSLFVFHRNDFTLACTKQNVRSHGCSRTARILEQHILNDAMTNKQKVVEKLVATRLSRHH